MSAAAGAEADVVIIDPEHLAITGDGPVLRGSRCPTCDQHFFPWRWECALDQTPCHEVPLSREGRLHIATYVHVPAYGKRAVSAEGYGVGQIDLPEGVRIQAMLAGDRAAWTHGARMRLVTEAVGTDAEGRTRLSYRFAPSLS